MNYYLHVFEYLKENKTFSLKNPSFGTFYKMHDLQP